MHWFEVETNKKTSLDAKHSNVSIGISICSICTTIIGSENFAFSSHSFKFIVP